jgi:replicative DNA helicase Mcm
MSATTVVDDLASLYRDYYEEQLSELVTGYPADKQSLHLEAKDLYRRDPDLLDDYREHPQTMREHAEEALQMVDLPVDQSFDGANVRLTDTHGYLDRVGVGSLYAGHETKLVALRGRVGSVTGAQTKLTVATFHCKRCGCSVEIPQTDTEFQEPHECKNCGREGPFQIDFGESEKVDQRKLKLEQPPHEQSSGSGQSIEVYAYNDLIHAGGENGLADIAGQEITVIGEYIPDETDLQGRGSVSPTYDCYFKAHNIVLDDDADEQIDVDEYRHEVERHADKPNAIDRFKRSIDPGLTMTDEWDMATEMATAYLFGAPRIDPDGGDMVRGDLHMLFVSDPGMRKSVFADKVANISPQAELRQATGMSSDVGLTSAAQQDEFGDGGWSLSPGALPRANGGHLILDEIDKGPGLGGIHDALEGAQELKVDKAGIQATWATRVGFMALGNPTDGRFDPYEPIAEQIDLDPALMSRFDLIITMEDEPDEDDDEAIAGGVLDVVDESARLEYGDMDVADAESVTPDISRPVMRAWVKLAREEVQPLLTSEAKTALKDYYVQARQLNGEDSETPPATARKLMAGIRLSMAFARVELSERVEQRHAERAIRVSKHVIGNNFDPESGEFDADRTTESPSTQQQQVKAIKEELRRASDPLELDQLADRANISTDVAEHRIEKLLQNGVCYEPQTGYYEVT